MKPAKSEESAVIGKHTPFRANFGLAARQEVFEVAAELTGDERAACLQERCAGDESLRSEVESLLASDASPSTKN